MTGTIYSEEKNKSLTKRGKAIKGTPTHKIYKCVSGVPFLKAFDKPLSLQEEKEMIELSQKGDMNARNVLVEKNMRLVAHMVKKYITPDRELEDLISVGTIGLIKAVNSFRPDKNIRLATYAAKCIDNELLMMLRADKRKAMEVSMYEPIGNDKEGNEISLIEVVGDEDTDVIEDYMFAQRMKFLYDNIDNILNSRESDIIKERFGLMGFKELTQSELAGKLNISRSYVSRIEKRALEKLMMALKEAGLS